MDSPQPQSLNRSMTLYWRDFLIYLIGLTIIVAVISYFIDVGAGVRLLVPFFTALFIGELFIKKESRGPSKSESMALTNGSFLIQLIVNVGIVGLLGLLMLAIDGVPDLSAIVVIVAASFFLIIQGLVYLFLYVAYGWVTRRRADKLVQASKH